MQHAMRGRLPLSDRGPNLDFIQQAIDDSAASVDRYYLRQQTEGVTVTTVARFGATGAPSTSGAAVNVNDATGSYVNYSTPTTGTVVGWTNQSICIIPTSFPIRYTCVMKTGGTVASITDVRIQIGFANVISATLDSQTVSCAYFRYSTVAGDVNWQACTSDGTQGETDTGVPVAFATRYVFQIRIVGTSTYEFYINGILRATRTTNVPVSTQNMQLFCQLRNGAGPTVRAINIRLWTVESK